MEKCDFEVMVVMVHVYFTSDGLFIFHFLYPSV